MNKSVLVKKKAKLAWHDQMKRLGKPGIPVQPYHPLMVTLLRTVINGLRFIWGWPPVVSSSPNKIVIGGRWACEWNTRTNAATFYFNRPNDALLFKLAWGGEI